MKNSHSILHQLFTTCLPSKKMLCRNCFFFATLLPLIQPFAAFSQDPHYMPDTVKTAIGWGSGKLVYCNYPFTDNKDEYYYFSELKDVIKNAIDNFQKNDLPPEDYSDTLPVDSLTRSYRYYYVTRAISFEIKPISIEVSLNLNTDYQPVLFQKYIVFKPERPITITDGQIFFSRQRLVIRHNKIIPCRWYDSTTFNDTGFIKGANALRHYDFDEKFCITDDTVRFCSRFERIATKQASLFFIGTHPLLLMFFDSDMCTHRRVFSIDNEILTLQDTQNLCDP